MSANSFVDEVLRTIRKDAYRVRWPLLLFAVCTFAPLMNLLSLEPVNQYACVDECGSRNGSMLFSLMVLVLLCACLLPTLVVQHDSPTRVDAFWRFHPTRSSSIAIGKLMFALPVVPLIVSASQAVGIAIIDLPLLKSWYSVALVVYWMASLTMFSMLVAAVVPDIRAFLFAMIGFVALRATLVSGYLLGDWLTSVYVAVPGFRADVWLALAAGMLFWAYTSRLRKLRTKRLILGLGICVLAFAWDTGDAAGIRFLNRANEIANRALPAPRFSAQRSRAGVSVQMITPAPPPGSRFVFLRTQPTVQFKDATERLQLTANTQDVPLVRRYGSKSPSDSVVAQYEIGFEPETQIAIANRTASVLIDGFLVEQRDTLIGEFGSVLGSSLQNGADRLIVRTVSYDTMPKAIGIEQLHIGRAPLFATVANTYQHRPKNAYPSSGVQYTQRLPDSPFDYFAVYSGARDTLKLGERREGGSTLPLAIPVSDASRPFILLASRDPQGRTLSVPNWLTPDTRIVVRQWKYKSYRPVHAVVLLPQQLKN